LLPAFYDRDVPILYATENVDNRTFDFINETHFSTNCGFSYLNSVLLVECETLQSLHQYLGNTLSTLYQSPRLTTEVPRTLDLFRKLNYSTNHYMAMPDEGDLAPTTATTSAS